MCCVDVAHAKVLLSLQGNQRFKASSCMQEPSAAALVSVVVAQAAVTPAKSTASTRDHSCSGSGSKRPKKAAAEPEAPARQPSGTVGDAATSGLEPARRAARASAVSAMASWKQSRIFTDEEESGSDDDGRDSRRGKKVRNTDWLPCCQVEVMDVRLLLKPSCFSTRR
jgi:hypothetical protein